jgi:hypothetical protein
VHVEEEADETRAEHEQLRGRDDRDLAALTPCLTKSGTLGESGVDSSPDGFCFPAARIQSSPQPGRMPKTKDLAPPKWPVVMARHIENILGVSGTDDIWCC